jgi:glycine cleavage system H protein
MDVNALKYAKTHEWVALEGEIATIGITDFAVQALTDLVYMDLPAVGNAITAGQRFGEVESVKAVSDLYAPVSGEVTAVNSKVVNDLGLLSDKPFDTGWLIKVKVDGGLPESLLDRTAYVAHCDSEKH